MKPHVFYFLDCRFFLLLKTLLCECLSQDSMCAERPDDANKRERERGGSSQVVWTRVFSHHHHHGVDDARSRCESERARHSAIAAVVGSHQWSASAVAHPRWPSPLTRRRIPALASLTPVGHQLSRHPPTQQPPSARSLAPICPPRAVCVRFTRAACALAPQQGCNLSKHLFSHRVRARTPTRVFKPSLCVLSAITPRGFSLTLSEDILLQGPDVSVLLAANGRE